MKLPLIVSALPKSIEAPRVSLSRGLWKIEDNIIDTKYHIMLSGGSTVSGNGETFRLESNRVARVIIDQAGKEEHISIFVHKLE